MKSIRLENIRCLADTGHIKIKPITVILGENSSGKSTFIRTFPLFRQSVSEAPRGPILLYGNYVDFGELKNLMTKGSNKDHIIFSIDLEENIRSLFGYHIKDDKHFEIKATISIKDSGNNNPYVSGYKICFREYKIEFQFENGKVTEATANGEKFDKFFSELRCNDNGRLFPSFNERKSSEYAPQGFMNIPLVSHNSNWSRLNIPVKLEQELISSMKSQTRSGTSRETINDILSTLTFFTIRRGNTIEKMEFTGTSTWKKNASKISTSKISFYEFKKIENIISINAAILLAERINIKLNQTFNKIRYIAPVRATAERYYRKRNIAVSEVDFRGENLPMYIASLPNNKMEKLNLWLEECFSLKLQMGKEVGHLSLEIQHTGNNHIFNMADMGFGFSQVMPILVQLWSIIENESGTRNRNTTPIIYVMEQPELHLHPRLQGVLATILCKATNEAKLQNIDLRIIIETHSESIIGKIGRLIASGKMPHEDTNVVIFNKLPNENTSEISIASYTSSGQLENWPWGFFD